MQAPLAQVSVVSPQNAVEEPSSASGNLTSPQPWTLEDAETSHHLAAVAHPMSALGQGPHDRGHGKSQVLLFSSFSSLAEEEPSYQEALERRSPLGEDALSCWGLGPCKPPAHPDGHQVPVREQIPPPFRQDPLPFFLSSLAEGEPIYQESLERRSPLGEDALSCWGSGPCKPPAHPDGHQVPVREQFLPPFRQDPFPFFLSSLLVGFPGNPPEVALCLPRTNG